MTMTAFWRERTLAQLTPAEWESLCDGCAGCCLFKAASADGRRTARLPVVCRYLDRATQRCTCYSERHERVPDCVPLTPERARAFDWLPGTCAYRRVAEGRDLPPWHPLRAGHGDAVPRLGDEVISEADVHPEDFEDWVDAACRRLDREG